MSSLLKIESPDFIQGGAGKRELCKAMAEAFPEIRTAAFDKTNPHYKSKYATLGSVIEAIKPALASRGLWFLQNIHSLPGFASVETIIVHASGESMSCGITSIPVGKNDAQGYGSALTYAKRYSLSSAFSVVADEDDDGNEACAQSKVSTTYQKNEADDTSKIEKQRLSDSEIMDYAEEVKRRVENLPGKNYLIDYSKLVDYFKHLNARCKAPLREGIENFLIDPAVFISKFETWKSKQAE